MTAATTLVRPAPGPVETDELVASVHEVMRSVLHRAHPTLEAEGISIGQFWALHLVSSLRSASVSTVARHLAVSAPTVCVNVDQLEAAGLVTRHRSERDRRAVELSLTAKGRRVEARVWAQIGRLMAAAARHLSSEDVATAVHVFRELNRELDGTHAAPPGGA
ncbi:MAG: MarR family winged helix-turn-helix transcriptional regulator [Thermoplasmata archaeon]